MHTSAITKTSPTKTSSLSDATWFREGLGQPGRFLCLPMVAVQDRRLKLEILRVLMALALHADVRGRCFPSRKRLSALTGMHPTNVSKATSALVTFGWLNKHQRKGRSAVYVLKIPDRVAAESDQDIDPKA